MTQTDFRTDFVRAPATLRHFPALVLNADYRPLSYYPLSLWPWQEAIKAAWLDRVDIVSEYDEVNHNYEREHDFNLWFVLTAPTAGRISAVIDEITGRTGLPVMDLPLEEAFHIDLGFRLQWN